MDRLGRLADAVQLGTFRQPDEVFEAQLAAIEEQIHGSKDRVRYAMNSALMNIGGRAKVGRSC